MPGSVVQSVSASGSTTPITTSAFTTAPPSGDIVATLVSSDTTMTAGPASATQRGSNVGGQGAYWYDKVAGVSEPTTVTVTPNGAFATSLVAIDLTGVTAFDAISTVASTQGSPGQTSRAITSMTTAAGNGDLVIAAALCHGITGAALANFAWTNGFTHLGVFGANVTGSTASALVVGYKIVAASTAVGATTVSWPTSGAAGDTTGWMVGYKQSSGGGGASATPSPINATGFAVQRASSW